MAAVTDEQCAALRAWASQVPQIRRVFLFGSRIKGTHRPDSDLDIALEIEPGEDSNATLSKWMHCSGDWRTEIAALLPFEVDVQWLDTSGTTQTIEKGIAEASQLIYERAQSPGNA